MRSPDGEEIKIYAGRFHNIAHYPKVTGSQQRLPSYTRRNP